MKAIESRRLRTTFIPVVCGMFAAALANSAFAQGLPVDWSHRHVIYSNPDTEEEAAAKGKLGEWVRKANDPRFILQLERKEAKAAAKQALADGEDAVADTNSAIGGKLNAISKKKKPPAPTGPQIHRDWSNVMGGVSGSGSARTYPAKFAFGITAKDCASDFVVFTTSTAGATGSGALATRAGLFFGAAVTTPTADTVTITNGTRSLTLTASAAANTGLFFQPGGSASASAANLAAAINRNGGTVGVTATNSFGPVVQVTAITDGTGGNSITLADNNARFIWFGDTLAGGSGTAGQPTIFALNQLYADTTGNSGCQTATQPVPATYWSYNTGTGAVADLSPVLSFYDNGAQVAFMQRSGAVSSLVLLKWSSGSPGTIGAPTAPTSVTPANYRTCTPLPCMTVMALNGNRNNTNSSPYVDYAGDALYVGDDTGKLHKFTGVFQGTPAEVVSAAWPAQVAATTSVMSSPVFDGTSTVYIGSSGPGLGPFDGNRLHRVDAVSGLVTTSGSIGSQSAVNGVRDAPIVDTTTGKVYAFQGAFQGGGSDFFGFGCNGGTCNTVFQFATGFATGNTGSFVYVGKSLNSNNLQTAMSAGTFDDAFYSSGSGSLYVCGSQVNSAQFQELWKIPIVGGNFSLSAPPAIGPILGFSTLDEPCSPPTVFKNGSAEYLYVSVNSAASANVASGGSVCTLPGAGCMYVYTLTPVFNDITTQATAALNATGGTGGIIIDNTVTTGGGSQVYYSTRTSPGNAVQASQAALK